MRIDENNIEEGFYLTGFVTSLRDSSSHNDLSLQSAEDQKRKDPKGILRGKSHRIPFMQSFELFYRLLTNKNSLTASALIL